MLATLLVPATLLIARSSRVDLCSWDVLTLRDGTLCDPLLPAYRATTISLRPIRPRLPKRRLLMSFDLLVPKWPLW
ncbi:hypothetical protein TNCV_394801 [Trichonephila clavipes]|nr:hypothetical protein TNCV_394801 [Trichonephila clavipes]